jgi:tetratricopeptide (TPR) repeat protein
LDRLQRMARRHADLALERLSRLETQARAQGELALAFDALYLRFYVLEARGRATELQTVLPQAARDAQAAQLPVQAARLAEAQGRLAYQQGDYLEATEHWSRALDGAEASGEVRVGVSARIGLGQVHYAMGAWTTGLRFHRDALTRLQTLQDDYLAAKVALNLGVGHLECQQLEDAERHFSHGLAAARRGGHREFEAEAHWHLAQTALARGQTAWATADCRLALDIAGRLQHHWLEAAASRTWTEIALARGDEAAAIRSTRHGLQLAERIHSKAEQRAAHLQLAKLLERQGEFREALQHLWQHLALLSDLERQSQPAARLERLQPEGLVQAGGLQIPSRL